MKKSNRRKFELKKIVELISEFPALTEASLVMTSAVSEEPENLSLKPEDRYAAAERERQNQKRLRT